jgi:histidinol-phosphatase
MNSHRCQVSDVSALDDASLSYSSFGSWEQVGRLEDLLSLGRRCWRTRAYGDFWSHMMVAEGSVDIAVEPDLEVYDMAALAVIVEESGGRFTSLAGQPGPHGGDALTTNGKLHDQALAFVGSVPAADDPDEPGRPGGSVHDLSSHRRRPTT